MEGISGHLSSRDGFSRHGPTLTAAPEWPDKPHANGYFYGEHDYRSHPSHHHQQQQPQQSIMRGNGGGNSGMGVGTGVGRGSGNVRGVPHLHQHQPSSVSHQADRHEMSILSSSRDPQSRDLSMSVSGDAGGPSRMGMSVQDLKNMTAIRMAHQQGGQSSGSPRQSPPGTTSQGQQPSRSVIVHPQDLNTARGVSAGPQHIRGHNAGQQQNQHQQSTAIMPQLSRRNSAQAMGVSGYSGHQNSGGRAQLVVTQGGRGLDQGVHVMDQHHIPQRSMHRGSSAPRLFSQSDESNGAGRVFAHGLSVEELKEMTKLRLQNQQGRASPPSTLQRSSSASRGGGTRGDMHHDRMEWRHGSLNDRRSMIEEPLHGMPRRPSALSLGHGVSRESVPAAGLGRRMYNGNAAAGRDSVGRMDTPLLLEDRMRALQTETAGGSPRILSQPSSPCYSQPGSPTSSPCHSSHNSPGRHNRSGQGGRRDGGGGNGAAVSGSSSVGHNYPTPPPGFSEGPGNVQHVSLRLNGTGGSAGGIERALYLRRGASSDFSQTSSSGSSGGMNGGTSGAGGAPALLLSRSYSDASPHVSPHLGASGTSSRRGSPLMDSTGPTSVEGVEPANGNAYGARVVRTRSYDGRVTAASMLGVPRPSSASLSPPAGESHLGLGDILANGVHGHGGMTGAGGGSELDRVRRSSFDDRLPARWAEAQEVDLSASAHGSTGGRKGTRRPASLNLGADHFDQLRSAAAAVTASGAAGPSSSYGGGLGLNSGLVGPELPSARTAGGGGVRGVPASTKDAIPTQCAEFALLTPTRALVQQAGSATMASWSNTWDSDDVNGERAPGGGDAATGGALNAGSIGGRDTVDTEFVHGNGPGPGPEGGVRGSTGSDPLMQHAAGGMFGGLNSAVECQVAHSGSSEGSPEPFGASRGTVDETEENGASSCGSGGGGRQHNVQAAFEVLDAAVGRGGGGGEASNGSSGNGNGAGYDGYAIGSDVHDAVRNGGVEVEAQRFGCPVPASVPASAFFGEDLPDCAGMSLEGDDEETSSEQQGSLGGGKSSPPPLAVSSNSSSSSSPGSIYAKASTTVAHNRTPSPAQQQQQQQPKHSPSGVASDPLATAMENQLSF